MCKVSQNCIYTQLKPDEDRLAESDELENDGSNDSEDRGGKTN
jgi:hypothetical protein